MATHVKKLFWRFWLAAPEWAAPRRFKIHYSPYMLGGTLYVGVTLFGWSILYSTEW
jgi:hypothetical protein